MSATLITGADGYLGQLLAREMLRADNRQLVLFVRAADDEERAAKEAALGDLASNDRCDLVFGDLRNDQPFGGIDPSGIDGVLHSAAVTNFAVDKDSARAVNVEGTAKVLEFARRCPDLRRLGLVSSIYAVGEAEGTVKERLVDEEPSFANHYEWSKWQAETLVGNASDLPWQIYRVATILAEDAGGQVVQQNAIHNTLRLLYYGLLSVIPGNAESRVYTVSGAQAAGSIWRLFNDGDERALYHVSDSGSDAMTLDEMTSIVYDIFLDDPNFAKRRILKPLFCDREAFDTLVAATEQLGGPVGQALDSVAPFAPQLFFDKDVETALTNAALGDASASDPRELVSAVAKYLVNTRWGIKEAS